MYIIYQDPQEILKAELSGSCSKYQAELDACTERVSAKSKTTETCEQELYDFIHCRDFKVSIRPVGIGLSIICAYD